MKRWLKIVLGVLLLLVVAELSLRVFAGLGNAPVYITDKDFEYIYAPNQHARPFGNKVETNEYSMRSAPLSPSDRVRILKLGDSIINGGSQTDNDSLASTLLENELSAEFKQKIRVLNISAGSWGPDNAFAYIKKYGDFNSHLFVLIFSSHDFYDAMQHEQVVGVLPSYPDKKPIFALTEAFERYILPRIESKTGWQLKQNKLNADPLLISALRNKVNPGWNAFFNYTKQKGIQLLVVLHPTAKEVKAQEYDVNGKKIIHLLDSAKVDYLLELKSGQALTEKEYRDDIHYNNKGQKVLAAELHPYLKKYVQSVVSN